MQFFVEGGRLGGIRATKSQENAIHDIIAMA